METELILKSKAHAQKVLGNLPKTYTYHNLQHTHEVVAAAHTIGKQSNLSDDEMESLLIAAWLHDKLCKGLQQS